MFDLKLLYQHRATLIFSTYKYSQLELPSTLGSGLFSSLGFPYSTLGISVKATLWKTLQNDTICIMLWMGIDSIDVQSD